MYDEYVAFLNHQIKEEVVNGYLRERRILEEEKKEFQEQLSAYRDLILQSGLALGRLANLLISKNNFIRYFNIIGLDDPPRQWPIDEENWSRPPKNLDNLTIKGFTGKGRYIGLILDAYQRFFLCVEDGRSKSLEIAALVAEINRDIKLFELNFDTLGIISFLKSMDSETLFRKRILGDNYTYKETSAIQDTLAIPTIRKPNELACQWPSVPPATEIRPRVSRFLTQIFKQENRVLMPILKSKAT